MALNAPVTAAHDAAKGDEVRRAPPGPAGAPAPRRRWFARHRGDDLRIYQHSNLFYWWVIWVYGFFCAGLTYVQGIGVRELASGAEKVVLFHPSPWLGISFILLILFVAVFSNVRARGVYSFMLILVAAALLWGIMKIPGAEAAFAWLPLLRVHLNLAFYLTFSILLLLIWTCVIVLVDHFSWWRFSPGQVVEEHLFGQATEHAYNTEMMVVKRLPDDLFRHRILGLGTGDFMIKPAHESPFEIHNVWRARRKQRRMEAMIAKRVMETARAD
jgi:hypothetical protein